MIFIFVTIFMGTFLFFISFIWYRFPILFVCLSYSSAWFGKRKKLLLLFLLVSFLCSLSQTEFFFPEFFSFFSFGIRTNLKCYWGFCFILLSNASVFPLVLLPSSFCFFVSSNFIWCTLENYQLENFVLTLGFFDCYGNRFAGNSSGDKSRIGVVKTCWDNKISILDKIEIKI